MRSHDSGLERLVAGARLIVESHCKQVNLSKVLLSSLDLLAIIAVPQSGHSRIGGRGWDDIADALLSATPALNGRPCLPVGPEQDARKDREGNQEGDDREHGFGRHLALPAKI
jgi:hypothetical protein